MRRLLPSILNCLLIFVFRISNFPDSGVFVLKTQGLGGHIRYTGVSQLVPGILSCPHLQGTLWLQLLCFLLEQSVGISLSDTLGQEGEESRADTCVTAFFLVLKSRDDPLQLGDGNVFALGMSSTL